MRRLPLYMIADKASECKRCYVDFSAFSHHRFYDAFIIIGLSRQRSTRHRLTFRKSLSYRPLLTAEREAAAVAASRRSRLMRTRMSA